MDLEVLKSEDTFLEFIMKGERHTIPNLLKARLAGNPEVSFVAYDLAHPSSSDAKFVLRTRKASARKVLLQACTDLEKELSDLASVIKKSLK